MISQAGGEGDPVVRGGLEVAPVRVGDDLHHRDCVGPGAVDGGVGDGIALLQVLDRTNGVLGSTIVVE